MNNQSLYGTLYVCRNCEYYKSHECCEHPRSEVSSSGLAMKPDDFCNYFEMKEYNYNKCLSCEDADCINCDYAKSVLRGNK